MPLAAAAAVAVRWRSTAAALLLPHLRQGRQQLCARAVLQQPGQHQHSPQQQLTPASLQSAVHWLELQLHLLLLLLLSATPTRLQSACPAWRACCTHQQHQGHYHLLDSACEPLLVQLLLLVL
jgi:hypothetical protein